MLELSNVSTFQSLLFLFWANVICRSMAVAILAFHDYIRYSLKCDDPTKCLQVKCSVEKNTSNISNVDDRSTSNEFTIAGISSHQIMEVEMIDIDMGDNITESVSVV